MCLLLSAKVPSQPSTQHREMRLLFVHERFGPLGGAEANILLTAKELQGRGHSVAIAHGGAGSTSSADWNQTFGTRFPIDQSASLEESVNQFRPDIIFLHKYSDPRILNTLVSGRQPVVRMVHDHDLYCMRSYKYNYLSREICTRAASPYCIFPCGACIGRSPGTLFPVKWVSYFAKRREIDLNKKFHRMVVATDYMRDELLLNGFSQSQIEIHAPVPNSAKPTDTPSFSDRNLIVYSGQIIRGKGVDVLLRTLAKVESPFECRILGDGNQRTKCELLTDELGLRDRVQFEGFVPQSRIAELYRDASVAVMSSLWPEPFGAAGLEAMRVGLPVVAFDAGGISEWLLDGVNGYLAPWMDSDTFALRLDTLLQDKALARSLGTAGRSLANERFNFDSYVGGLEGLFARAARQGVATQGN
jgi:glycosyltransferase involved in cell wall biosynthesis